MSFKNQPFDWTETAEKSFGVLNKCLEILPILAFPDLQKQFVVILDFYSVAEGLSLLQKKKYGRLCPVRYATPSPSNEEKQYSTFKQEDRAVVFSLKNFRQYRLSRPFVVFSDNQALRAASWEADTYGCLAR